MNTSSEHPQTCEIIGLMAHLGYQWSNQAQTYYDYDFQHISSKSAERIYRNLLKNEPFDWDKYSSNLPR